MKYSFFVQPQINQNNSIFGYEVLLRKETNGNWTLPKNFTELSIAQQVKLVEQTAEILKRKFTDHKTLSFNLNQQQADDPATIKELIHLKKKIAPIGLNIELTEAISLEHLQEISRQLHQNHIPLVIDDVGTGSNTFENIQAALPYVDKIKLAMQNLRSLNQADQIPDYLAFWAAQAKKYCLDTVLEGVEDVKDQLLAQRYHINIQQGYLYGKPAMPM